MSDGNSKPMALGRALLVLGRASNLPTVWSNCLVAYALGGFISWAALMPVLVGATFFYLGGMYLNDAFDVGFDRRYRQERPIPSGAIQERTVWILGALQLMIGMIFFSAMSQVPWSLSLLLTATIIVYNALHKTVSFSPILMSLCRFVLFLSAASMGVKGINGLALWSALALAGYIIGLSYVAKRESSGGLIGYWPCLLLAFPPILAFLVNVGSFRTSGLVLIAIYTLWTGHCLWQFYGRTPPNIGRGVSRLLAGIVITDLLALGSGDLRWTILLMGLFIGALVFQRFIPAT